MAGHGAVAATCFRPTARGTDRSNVSSAAFLLNSGAQGLFVELARPARGRVGDLICAGRRQRPAVEHRSSYTDQVVTAILAAASGGGARPALATAALETCASLYAGALSACEVSGPSSITRALDASWRANDGVGANQARPVRLHRRRRSRRRALTLCARRLVSTCTAAPMRPWVLSRRARGAVEYHDLADTTSSELGPTSSLGWSTDTARPWAGISPLQHASRYRLVSRAGSKNGWPEEASGPVG